MKKRILQQAFEELSDAIAYYEDEQVGLGLRLKDEVELAPSGRTVLSPTGWLIKAQGKNPGCVRYSDN